MCFTLQTKLKLKTFPQNFLIRRYTIYLASLFSQVVGPQMNSLKLHCLSHLIKQDDLETYSKFFQGYTQNFTMSLHNL